MTLALPTLAAFIGLFALVQIVFSQIFKEPMLNIPTHEAQLAAAMRLQLRYRELHIIAALIIGIGTGLVHCWWGNVSMIPLLVAFATFETLWLLLNFVAQPRAEQKYFDRPHFETALVCAAIAGTIASLLMGAATLPLIVGGLLFLVAWCLLTPL